MMANVWAFAFELLLMNVSEQAVAMVGTELGSLIERMVDIDV